MKRVLSIIILGIIFTLGLFANPLAKALEEGEWIEIENTNLSIQSWKKNDVTLDWCNQKNYHYVKISDNEETIVIDDWESPDYAKIANVKWCIIDKNKDPNVEWLEVKNNKLTGRKLIKKSSIISSNIAPATKTTRGAVTAASRASDAKEDYIWEE